MFLEEYLSYYHFFYNCSYFTLKNTIQTVNWSCNNKDFESMNGLIDECDIKDRSQS